MAELMFKSEVYEVVGVAMSVYNELGPGFLEAVYQESFEIECELSDVPVIPQSQLQLMYKGRKLKKRYVADALCFGEVIVEIKTSAEIANIDLAQLINYLKASGKRVGVLICFGHENELKWQRVAV